MNRSMHSGIFGVVRAVLCGAARRGRVLLPACLAAALLLPVLAGCSGGSGRVPTVALATEGPPLALEAEYDGMALEGSMDRTCMAGIGRLTLHSKDPKQKFFCEAKINAEPTDKGRIRGILDCSRGKVFMFSLRNIGPDQGVGIAKASGDDELMVIFYHASKEEAARRFPSVKRDIEKVKNRE